MARTKACVGCKGGGGKAYYARSRNKEDHCWGSRLSCNCICATSKPESFCNGCFTNYSIGSSGYCDACVTRYMATEADPRILQYIENQLSELRSEIVDQIENLEIRTQQGSW